MHRVACLVVLVCLASYATADDQESKPISAAEAAKMVGKKVTVEMDVKSTGNGNGVVFLNSEENFRNAQNFTAFVGKDGVKKFKEAGIDDPAKHFQGKKVRVTGTVKLFREKPEIVVEDPKQIEVVEKKS